MKMNLEKLKSRIQAIFNTVDSNNLPKTAEEWLKTWSTTNDYVITLIESFGKELRDILKEEVYGDEVYYHICDSCVMHNTCLEYCLECEALQKLKEILGES